MIKACLNGTRRPAEHPGLPTTPPQLAMAAAGCFAQGAFAVHIHPRDAHGLESLAAADCGAAVAAVRARCPGAPVGLTTGLWITGSVPARLEAIAGWEVLPDFVSVNFAEEGAIELCRLLQHRGIGIEAGLASVDDAIQFVESKLAVVRVWIEVDGEAEEAIASAEAIESVLAEGRNESALLEHGYDAATWEVIRRALARGHDVRVGLEDTLVLPGGRVAADNAELVAAARNIADAVGA